MSKRIVLSIFIFLMVTSVFAFENQSFRRQSTAYLIDDDLDFWVTNAAGLLRDPANLCLIQGYRLYTNLSNLVSSDEGVFSNSSNHSFFMGGSMPLYDWGYLGVLVDQRSDKKALSTGLWNRFGYSLYGEGERIESKFEDLDNNGSFDSQSVTTRTAEAWQNSVSTSALIAFAKMFTQHRLGIFYEYQQSKDQSKPSVSSFGAFGTNFISEKTSTNLITNELLAIEENTGVADVLLNSTSHTMGMSLWRKHSPTLSLGLQAFFGMSLTENEDQASEIFLRDASPNLTATDSYESVDELNSVFNETGTILGICAAAKKIWTPNINSDFNVSYIRRSFSVDNGAKLEDFAQEITKTTVGPGTLVATTGNQVLADISGDLSGSTLDFYSRSLAKINDRTIFGIGLGINLYKGETTREYDQEQKDVESFDDGDAEDKDADDYTTTVTSTNERAEKTSVAGIELRIPVGLEVEVVKRLKLRLGAEYRYQQWESNITDDLVKSAAAYEITTYGDGTTDEKLVNDPYSPINGTREYSQSTSSYTAYFYGAGYQVSDNVQIDLMGFSQLTNLNNWKLSVILKF